jgi:predicted P-loop ATPase
MSPADGGKRKDAGDYLRNGEPIPRGAVDFLIDIGGMDFPHDEWPYEPASPPEAHVDDPPRNVDKAEDDGDDEGDVSREATDTWRQLLNLTRSKAKNKDGECPLVPRASAHNVTVFLRYHPEWRGVLAFNERHEAPVFTREPPFHEAYSVPSSEAYPRILEDLDTAKIAAWLERSENLGVQEASVYAGVLMAARRKRFEPVRRYLDGLTWDGTRRLDTWLLHYIGADDTPFNRAVGRKWLVAGVARARKPGCKVDTALVLEGRQGAGKSKALEALCPDPTYFADELADLRSKDAPLGLAGKWIIELSELAALGRSEVEVVKAFLSRQKDTFRPPYAKSAKDHPRRVIFAGSTNADAYLKDDTGGRRFWPVKVGVIHVDELVRDRDQLWAEADACFKAGEKWWIYEEDLKAAAAVVQDERYVHDEWENLISTWVDEPLRAHTPRFTVADVLRGAVKLSEDRLDPAAQARCAKALKRLGWTRRQVRTASPPRTWFYFRPSPPSPLADDEREDR